jgi:hypothetical protein
VLAFAASCGSTPPGSAPAPDAPESDGHELSIALFKHAPFADGDTGNAALVAIQDGDDAWTAVAADGGVYRAHLTAERYGVAIACLAGASSQITVFQRTAADGLELRTRSCDSGAIELDIAVQHVPASSIAYISTSAGRGGGSDATYAFLAQPGPVDLFASLTSRAGRMAKLVRLPTFDLQARQMIGIDFATQGAAPEERALSIALGAADRAQVTTAVIRPSGEYPLHAPAELGTPRTYQVLPLALWESDDLFAITVEVGGQSSTVTSKVPGALAFQLPPGITAQDPAIAIAPFVHPTFSFTTTTTDLPIQSYVLSARTANAPETAAREWNVELSASWIAGAPTVRYELPDLSAVPGFVPELALFERGPIRWSVRRTETSTAGPSDGRVSRSAVQTGVIDGYCGDHVVQLPETCDPPDGTACAASCTKL